MGRRIAGPRDLTRPRTKQSSASLRLLQYLRPYRGRLLVTAALMVGFALTSGITIGMISPFVKILFTPRHQAAVGPRAPGAAEPAAPIAMIPGVGGMGTEREIGAGPAPGASAGAPESGIAPRFTGWKRDMRTWFEGFFMTGDPIRSLNRICLTLLIVFLLKNAFDYLQSVLTVWVEQGPLAILAGVIRGNPPQDLKAVFVETIEKIHLWQVRDLEAFEGDASPFERSRPLLEACLKAERQGAAGEKTGARRKFVSTPLKVALAVVVAGLALLAVFSVRRNRRWNDYLARLGAMPGIVVTSSESRGGKLFINGLRDPLARDPAAMLGPAKLDAADVVATWRPYQGLDPELVLARAKRVLEPPPAVRLEVRDGVLSASGAAPHRWIAAARKESRLIPGILRFEDRDVVDTDRRDLEAVKGRIENRLFLFSPGSAELSPSEAAKLPEATADFARLQAIAASMDLTARVEVTGRGDSEGTDDINRPLSRRRAERVVAALGAKGIGTANIVAVGVGSARPLREERTDEDKQYNRSVSFRVVLGDVRAGETPNP